MIERSLLWDAHPDGYLAKKGLWTLGGYFCLGIKNLQTSVQHNRYAKTSLWVSKRRLPGGNIIHGLPGGGPPYEARRAFRPEMSMFRAAADLGELLPDVNPDLEATWAILKIDVARTFGYDHREIVFREWKGLWRLEALADGSQSAIYDEFRSFRFETDDIAEALVRAKIQALKEKKEREEDHFGGRDHNVSD